MIKALGIKSGFACAAAAVFLVFFAGDSLSAEEKFTGIGNHNHKKAVVEFRTGAGGAIVAFVGEPRSDGSFPKDGWIQALDMNAFDEPAIRAEMGALGTLRKYYVLDYEVIKEPDEYSNTYIGLVYKAIPLETGSREP